MERSDIFSTANMVLRNLPEQVHLITWIILLILYAHLLYGSYIERKKLKRHVRWYLRIRGFMMIGYLCIKAADVRYGMFDLFLPIYLLFYIDGLIIVKGYTFHCCTGFFSAMKKLTKFTSAKNESTCPNSRK